MRFYNQPTDSPGGVRGAHGDAAAVGGAAVLGWSRQMCQQACLGAFPDPIRAAKEAVRRVFPRAPKS
jgi:hypothetical protein